MKKYLITCLLCLSPILSSAQQNSAWNIVKVPTDDGKVAGYIFHTYAVGTKYGKEQEKSVTGLRLICSATKGNSTPIVSIYWDKESLDYHNQSQDIEISIDDKAIETSKWVQEGKISYRNLYESGDLIEKMRLGSKISFTWKDTNGLKRSIIFNLKGFGSNLDRFGESCLGKI